MVLASVRQIGSPSHVGKNPRRAQVQSLMLVFCQHYQSLWHRESVCVCVCVCVCVWERVWDCFSPCMCVFCVFTDFVQVYVSERPTVSCHSRPLKVFCVQRCVVDTKGWSLFIRHFCSTDWWILLRSSFYYDCGCLSLWFVCHFLFYFEVMCSTSSFCFPPFLLLPSLFVVSSWFVTYLLFALFLCFVLAFACFFFSLFFFFVEFIDLDSL